MHDFLLDVKHSIRTFRNRPAFMLTAVAALAVGIGAPTAIFSIVNTVLLKPLPVADPDRLVELTTVDLTTGAASDSATSPAKFAHWQAQSAVLEDVSAFETGVVTYEADGTVEQLPSLQASAEMFRCFGIGILLGRAFTAEEDRPNQPGVAVISQSLWNRRFAADPQIVGKTIRVNGEPHTVVGVAAEAAALLEFGPAPEVFVPFRLDPQATDQGEYFQAMARLKPGVSLQQARERLRASTVAFRAKFPKALQPKEGFGAVTFRESLVGAVRPLLLVLLGAVSLVLLIACSNVANLLLARAAGRRREIAIRAAIGAGRKRIVRQLLTESVLLALAGGSLGCGLGYVGIRALLAVNTADLPLVGNGGAAVSTDWRVMGFALLLSLCTGVAFGLYPALQGSRVDLHSALNEGGSRGGTGLRQNKTRAALVVSEVGLAVILLVGSALLIRTFLALYKVERGFETRNIVTMRMALTGPKYRKSGAVAEAVREAQERLRALPGVLDASATYCLPLKCTYDLNFEIVGRSSVGGPPGGDEGWAAVSPSFFETLRIPLKQGRTFSVRDDATAPPVAIVNESAARKYWKAGDPLRDRIAIGRGLMKEFRDEPVRQIIGIVGDVRDEGLENRPRPVIYVPQAQLTDVANALFVHEPTAWVVRTQADPLRLMPAIREQLRQATGFPVSEVQPMEEVVRMSIARHRFSMLLMTVFGGAALLLAAIGIYGLMSYTVEQRTQEIGIRLALGAGAVQVRNMVVRQGMTLALAGVVIGTAAAWGLARVIESLLFGVKARDPLVFAAVPLLLAAVALAAVARPAVRAARVSPMEALRYE
jgi:putative ABC transport system permease protein